METFELSDVLERAFSFKDTQSLRQESETMDWEGNLKSE